MILFIDIVKFNCFNLSTEETINKYENCDTPSLKLNNCFDPVGELVDKKVPSLSRKSFITIVSITSIRSQTP